MKVKEIGVIWNEHKMEVFSFRNISGSRDQEKHRFQKAGKQAVMLNKLNHGQ